MTLTPIKDLVYNTTSLAEDTTPAWLNISGYAIDTVRQKDNKLWKSLDLIDPLCEYIHDNSDPLNPNYTYDVLTETTQTNTAVRCELNVTVVYNKDNAKYYVFDNATGATLDTGDFYFVDFTTQDPNTPANFTEVTAYRHEVYEPSVTPLKWEDLGYTNKYKCLDSSLSSKSVSVGADITMSFIVSKINEIHLFNIYATDATVVVTTVAGSVELYNETISLQNKDGGTYYNYFFNDFIRTDKISSTVPIGTDVQVDITLTQLGGITELGLIAIGKSLSLGGTLYGADLSILDFSKKITDRITGETRLEQGNYKATNSLTVDVLSGLTDQVYKTLANYRGIPVVFSNDTFDSLKIFGIYNKFNILISTPTISKLQVDVESLI